MPNLTYLSLGSNVGDREAQLREAQARLRVIGRVSSLSSLYETEPVEFSEQPWFVNGALALETSQTPQQLMAELLRVEEEMGRRRLQKKGPRTIDIDILFFANQVIDTEKLTIPHPALHQRRFVLAPLAEIAPTLVHPLLGKTVQELLDALPPGQAVRKLERDGPAEGW